MRWNEVSKKTIGIIIAIGVLFAALVLVITFVLLRRHGGDTVAGIVKDAVTSQRVTSGGEGIKVVSDSLLVTIREGVERSTLTDIAARHNTKVQGVIQDQENTYIVSFRAGTVRDLRQLISIFKGYPDVIDAAMIPAE
ncbi:MAG: hypothetical protein Q7S09_03165 [bacterium]|nr:hypothetical protein [bacterium]